MFIANEQQTMVLEVPRCWKIHFLIVTVLFVAIARVRKKNNVILGHSYFYLWIHGLVL